jgi:hypothetical protein
MPYEQPVSRERPMKNRWNLIFLILFVAILLLAVAVYGGFTPVGGEAIFN